MFVNKHSSGIINIFTLLSLKTVSIIFAVQIGGIGYAEFTRKRISSKSDRGS